eukprot:9479330-Pyramimonas_sp.AAC.1
MRKWAGANSSFADASAQKPMSEKDRREKEFWEALEQDGYKFGARGAAGNPAAGRWQRELANNEDLAKRYSECGVGLKGRGLWAKQEQFRAEWAKGEHTSFKETKELTTTMRKEWEKKGQYLPLARIAWKEGGGKSGWAAAVKHYTKCIAMGGPFILYD